MTCNEIEDNCPEGYSICTGLPIDMLGITEVWRIFENNPEPDLTRIPQDLVDYPYGGKCAKRVPEEWGRCLYYKVV